MTENQKNPNEFGYSSTDTIPTPAEQFVAVRNALDFYLEKETKVFYPEKYKYINKDTGAVIKKVTEKNADVVLKVVDIEATLNSTPVIYRSKEGLDILRLKLKSEQLHLSMIDNGTAKHVSYYEELQRATIGVPEGIPEE